MGPFPLPLQLCPPPPAPSPPHSASKSLNSSKAQLCSCHRSKNFESFPIPSDSVGLSLDFENSRLNAWSLRSHSVLHPLGGNASPSAPGRPLSAPQGPSTGTPPPTPGGDQPTRPPRPADLRPGSLPRAPWGPRTPARAAPAAWELAGPPPRRESGQRRRPGAESRAAGLRCARWARPGRSARRRAPRRPGSLPAARAPASPRRHHHIVDDQVRRGQRPRAPFLPRAAGLAGPGPGPAAPIPLGRCSRRRCRHVKCQELALSGSTAARPDSGLRGGGGGAGAGRRPRGGGARDRAHGGRHLGGGQRRSCAPCPAVRLHRYRHLGSGRPPPLSRACYPPPAPSWVGPRFCHRDVWSALPVLSSVTSAHMLDEENEAFVLSS